MLMGVKKKGVVNSTDTSADTQSNRFEADDEELFTKREKSTLEQKYGFDIVYDAATQNFTLNSDGNPITLKESDLTPEAWNEKYIAAAKAKFGDSVKFETINIDLYKALDNHLKVGERAKYSNEEDTISIYNYYIPEGKRKDCIALYAKQYGLTPERAEEMMDSMLDTASRISDLEHEVSHRDDDKKFDNNRYDIPPEYMAKLDMMTEIKANMVQAGYALDMYKATGDLKLFDSLSINASDLKAALKNNPNMENKEAFVAQYIYDEWLKNHNKINTHYSQQAFMAATPHRHEYPLWALENNPQALEKYNARVSAMFENIEGLGDVRKIANPNFELNYGLKVQLDSVNIIKENENLHALMTKDAQNAHQYAANIIAYLKKVKEVDADGVRTSEEIAQLDAYLQQAIQPQAKPEQSGGANFAVMAALRNRER